MTKTVVVEIDEEELAEVVAEFGGDDEAEAVRQAVNVFVERRRNIRRRRALNAEEDARIAAERVTR